jgi:hypothetical protein
MELNEFTKKFLPDYETKKRDYIPWGGTVTGENFIEKYFPEAIKSFADKICKEQREKCVEAYILTEYDHYSVTSAIRHAEQPKINEP